MKPLLLLFIFSIFQINPVYLQESDTKLVWTEFHYGLQTPLNAMNDRFGTFFSLGSRAGMVLESGLSFSLNYHFFFGSKVDEDVLSPLRRSDGSIISEALTPSYPLSKMRGYGLQLYFGKWFKIEGKSQGWWLKAGPAFLQHKILIQDDADRLAQLRGMLRKGYDRLSNGFGAAASLGYMYISPNRQISLYASIEGGLYSVINRRGFNFDTQMIDDQPTTHAHIGLLLGWIIPIFIN